MQTIGRSRITAAMARRKTVSGGRVRGYYVQPHHERALCAFARRHGHGSASSAMRAVLDEVAKAYGVPLPEGAAA